MYNFIHLFVLQAILFPPLSEFEQIKTKIDSSLLASSNQIDIVYISKKFSHVEYRGRQSPQPVTPTFPIYSISPLLTPFGNCSQENGKLFRQDDRHCGYLIPLTKGHGPINLLGYDELSLTGQFSGMWELAFADTQLALTEENVPLGRIEASGTSRIAFGSICTHADVSRGKYLVLLLASQSGSAALENVSFRHVAHSSTQRGNGIWIWNRNQVLGLEEKVLDRLSKLSINRVYLQVADDPDIYSVFLRKAARRGVEVFALDGAPEYVASPEALLSRIQAVETYNRTHPDASYAGFQTDIEPYLNKDFNSRKEYYATTYIELLAGIKKRFNLPLSVVVPFWFDTVHSGERTLIQRIVETADEVVVMSYRTDNNVALDIARSTLALGENLRKPVRLGIELGAIPDEHHVEFEKSTSSNIDAIKIGDFWWRKHAEYDIKGSRISFKSSMPDLPAFMNTAIPFSSFNGWVLHSYEELP